jgi:hypothetical protein
LWNISRNVQKVGLEFEHAFAVMSAYSYIMGATPFIGVKSLPAVSKMLLYLSTFLALPNDKETADGRACRHASGVDPKLEEEEEEETKRNEPIKALQ